MIETSGLTKRFGSRTAVDRIDLQVEEGTCLSLFGHNGAGKTTLLRLLASGLKPTSGTIRVDGAGYEDEPEEIRRITGVLSHDSFLYDDLTARENLLFFARLHGVERPERAADGLLASMGLADRADDPVRAFSRGMTQRVAIARCLVHRPRVVYMDEPFSGLDPGATSLLLAALRDLRERNCTVLIATHDIRLGLRTGDRWLLLKGGRIRDGGPADPAAAGRIEDEHFGAAGRARS